MALVYLVIALILVEYMVFGWQVGRARVRYQVPAPATTGNEVFERYFRVHMNTLEQLVVVLPAMLIFGHYWGGTLTALLGLVFIVGRAMYYFGYIQAPAKRHAGSVVSSIPTVILIVGAIIGAVRALIAHGL
jgi:glutathione S-transferase